METRRGMGVRGLLAVAVVCALGCSSSSDGASGAGEPGAGPASAGAGATPDGGGAGSTPGGGSMPDGGTPIVGGTPSYPKDGFCVEPGVTWAYCEDFDGQGTAGPAPFVPANSALSFRVHSHVTPHGIACETSGDCNAYVQGGSLFLNAEDGGFGMNIVRVHQPFDFAGRQGRIHYKSDMKGHPRMHQNIHISPLVTNSMPDLRRVTVPDALDKSPAIDIDWVGDGLLPFQITTWKDGFEHEQWKGGGPVGVESGTLKDVDIFISRTHVTMKLDGVEVVNEAFEDIGFDRGYVYFTNLSYNPVKDGYSGKAANTMLWDDLAFDGPVLPKNSLTPPGMQDVLFRANSAASCTVRGVPAFGPILDNPIWDTWHVQFPASASPITAADVTCTTVGGASPDVQDVEKIVP